ncbi:unnamed protein product [Cylicocyclus nassatus]|uniref:Uncharacterized protein n=1 Tax=Cylicocyclus nassatus TaxID=53992 RepID=A0AA36M494_CYLNA|nr:unnamed protein product [Cylicocyclus nassatus]
MMKLLIAILYLASAASTLNISQVINSTNTYMGLPLVKANKFATKALLKVFFFITEFKESDEKFYKDLMAVSDDILSYTKVGSEEEFFAELMKKSPDLGARMKNMYDSRKKELAELKPEVQEFAENITEFMSKSIILDEHKAMPDSVAHEIDLGIIEKFSALSDDAKEFIKEKFPVFETVLEEATKRLQEH